MKRKLPIRDPIAAHQRKAVAARRFAENAHCACGESRPEALIACSSPIVCYECNRKKCGEATVEQHHVAGKSNSPITTPIPANDHRARLSTDQYDWPRKTLENPSHSPLLAIAASNRGFIDTTVYLMEKLLYENAEKLEALDIFLEERLGQNWWIGTPMEKYAPKR